MSGISLSRAAETPPGSSGKAPFLARHLAALALAALVVDVLVAYASRNFVWSVVPGWHSRIVAPWAVPGYLRTAGLLAAVHGLLAVALWQRLRHGKTHRAGH